ncbi:hypothetical protein EXIGLDRAFT_831140 [Exidia glandulosa HHB12029]|uniref:F-box domain-containing protein n=1 Tax=Exidia glandulosa HHB12029 TaxID=1314781 RepID=A0A165MXG3_EXIGL|nr:hypothetical protein EXIGLDRAFT_831140 [Exidia glandulosa HHB12029]
MLARDTTRRLPIELFAYVLDYLSQPDVLRCARVSSRWRTISSGHSNYYCFAALRASISPPWSASWHILVSRFCNTLRQCRRRNVHVKISLAVAFDYSGWLNEPDGTINRAKWPDDEPVYDLYVDRVLPAIKATLPFIIDLRISCVKQEYHGRIYDTLRGSTASALRSLCLDFVGSAFDLAAEPLPPDIFCGSAPRLRKLELYDIPLPASPLQVFSAVTHVNLELSECASLRRVLTHFPNATNLDLSRLATGLHPSDRVDERVEHRIRFLTVWLGHHDLLHGRDIAHALEDRNIPSVTINPIEPHTLTVLSALLLRAPQALAMTIEFMSHEFARVLLTAFPPELDDYVRGFTVRTGDTVIGGPQHMEMVLTELRVIQSALVSIIIDYSYLKEFIRATDVLPNLEILTATIDRAVEGVDLWAPPMASPPYWRSHLACRCVVQDWRLVPPMDDDYVLQCPKLAQVVVKGVNPVRVDRCQAAHLGRCLGIPLRVPHDDSPDGPVLCLGKGVSLHGETHALARVFPAVTFLDAADDVADV